MIDEVREFIAADEARGAAATEYARAQGEYEHAEGRLSDRKAEFERAAHNLVVASGLSVPPQLRLSEPDTAQLIAAGYHAAVENLVAMTGEQLAKFIDDTIDARAAS